MLLPYKIKITSIGILIILGLITGITLNTIFLKPAEASMSVQCGTCDDMDWDPGKFCNLEIIGGGCYMNTGEVPCPKNCPNPE